MLDELEGAPFLLVLFLDELDRVEDEQGTLLGYVGHFNLLPLSGGEPPPVPEPTTLGLLGLGLIGLGMAGGKRRGLA